jgi:hypothetical protein
LKSSDFGSQTLLEEFEMQTNLNMMRREFEIVKERMLSGGDIDLKAVSALAASDEDNDLHAGHRCPWHTCQATRH